jgi:hypothetical protein
LKLSYAVGNSNLQAGRREYSTKIAKQKHTCTFIITLSSTTKDVQREEDGEGCISKCFVIVVNNLPLLLTVVES